ncbi:MAG: adenylate/guanylate cyclase domain-containing protein [Armatimonadetes bacterium]|nr:adenylate/guanylate cyclase domain-containing protein [Armatimonadota bacterium]
MRSELEGGANEGSQQFGEQNVEQMLLLAERLRAEHGGDLDDSVILAVSEACNLPPAYVRLIINRLPDKKKGSLFQRLRKGFLALETDDRRYVIAGTLGALIAALNIAGLKLQDQWGLFDTLSLILLGVGLWNSAVSPNSRTAAFAGGLLGLSFFIMRSVFAMALRLTNVQFATPLFIPFGLGGMLAGIIVHRFANANRQKLGLQDPQEERQQLLRQLVELQDKLREGEQSMTFLSLDIVGSTKMKEYADPLSVEFTFTEYHKFCDMAARRFGGRVHSTAGDGVTCAFQHPQQAFQSARFIQAGLVELNAFRNKIGVPIVLRAGIHTGTVVAPPGQDISKINFSHVIDIAAHLQKTAPPGGVAISEDAAKMLPGGVTAVGSDQVEASGVAGRVWSPRVVAADGAQPPPIPPQAAPPPFDLDTQGTSLEGA